LRRAADCLTGSLLGTCCRLVDQQL